MEDVLKETGWGGCFSHQQAVTQHVGEQEDEFKASLDYTKPSFQTKEVAFKDVTLIFIYVHKYKVSFIFIYVHFLFDKELIKRGNRAGHSGTCL